MRLDLAAQVSYNLSKLFIADLSICTITFKSQCRYSAAQWPKLLCWHTIRMSPKQPDLLRWWISCLTASMWQASLQGNMQERCSKIHGVQMTSASMSVVNIETAAPISLPCTKYTVRVYQKLPYPHTNTVAWRGALPYLDSWERSVKERKGFSLAEQNKMMLSTETRLGLKFTGSLVLTEERQPSSY